MGIFQQFEDYDTGSSKRLRRPNVRLGELGYYALPLLMEKPLKRKKRKLNMNDSLEQTPLHQLSQGMFAEDGSPEAKTDSDKLVTSTQLQDVSHDKQSSFQINAGNDGDEVDSDENQSKDGMQAHWRFSKNHMISPSSFKKGKQGRRRRSALVNMPLVIREGKAKESPMRNAPNVIANIQRSPIINKTPGKLSGFPRKCISDTWDRHLKVPDSQKEHSSKLQTSANQQAGFIGINGEASVPYINVYSDLNMGDQKILAEVGLAPSGNTEKDHSEANIGILTNWSGADETTSLAVGVQKWLDTLGMSKYAKQFELHEVDHDVLPLLTLEDLREMGISAVGSRRKMFSALQGIGKEDASEG
ncbi:hypothetical protein O6H91_12G049100 [Diphasiastrum complanatum]|uniref:Uncharacterized protein n=3 Tax=Diphasiastrum complanatum TaxID=34168 RepID=A0ACC2C224_DIPCM|nr:hypothetical protein O6H91_12G049100 [Diphasiastrum complanatum]KAJ7535868.1 hypothetical protein O6H91_12G049100 [Diphasiastrum complanatum]KAJ7535869.1 hypothetical protein O6H91_12G049100 [Diphasiastrum complanatum]